MDQLFSEHITLPRPALEKNRDLWVAIINEIYIANYQFHPPEVVLESLFQFLIKPFLTLVRNCPHKTLSNIHGCLGEFFGDNRLHLLSSTFATHPNISGFQKQWNKHLSRSLSADLGSLNSKVLSYLSAYMIPFCESILQPSVNTAEKPFYIQWRTMHHSC